MDGGQVAGRRPILPYVSGPERQDVTRFKLSPDRAMTGGHLRGRYLLVNLEPESSTPRFAGATLRPDLFVRAVDPVVNGSFRLSYC
jgi:hypothetical protein